MSLDEEFPLQAIDALKGVALNTRIDELFRDGVTVVSRDEENIGKLVAGIEDMLQQRAFLAYVLKMSEVKETRLSFDDYRCVSNMLRHLDEIIHRVYKKVKALRAVEQALQEPVDRVEEVARDRVVVVLSEVGR